VTFDNGILLSITSGIAFKCKLVVFEFMFVLV